MLQANCKEETRKFSQIFNSYDPDCTVNHEGQNRQQSSTNVSFLNEATAVIIFGYCFLSLTGLSSVQPNWLFFRELIIPFTVSYHVLNYKETITVLFPLICPKYAELRASSSGGLSSDC